MSSRKEQKEKLREERLAREAAAKAAERRRRMMGFGVGGALAAAAIAAVVVAIAAGGGGGDDNKPKGAPANTVPIPAQKITNLDAAAKAAGCTLRTFTPGANDRQHVEGTVQYKQNPAGLRPAQPGLGERRRLRRPGRAADREAGPPARARPRDHLVQADASAA